MLFQLIKHGKEIDPPYVIDHSRDFDELFNRAKEEAKEYLHDVLRDTDPENFNADYDNGKVTEWNDLIPTYWEINRFEEPNLDRLAEMTKDKVDSGKVAIYGNVVMLRGKPKDKKPKEVAIYDTTRDAFIDPNTTEPCVVGGEFPTYMDADEVYNWWFGEE